MKRKKIERCINCGHQTNQHRTGGFNGTGRGPCFWLIEGKPCNCQQCETLGSIGTVRVIPGLKNHDNIPLEAIENENLQKNFPRFKDLRVKSTYLYVRGIINHLGREVGYCPN